MPGRQSHGAPPSKKGKVRTNNKKRSINAFAIAAQENPEKLKVRSHRLGESEEGSRLRKRARGEENGDDYGHASSAKRPRGGATTGRDDELNIDAGSDSEGNEWRMGEVDSEDDSELDSDEAFGESDEDRFDGFAFSGSSKNGKAQKNRDLRPRNLTLDEDVPGSQISSDPEDNDLGDGAIDLAAILDDAGGDDAGSAEVSGKHSSSEGETGSDGETDEESEDSEEESFASFADENDEHDPAKIAALQNLIANLPQAKDTNAPSRKQNNGANEYSTPSDFGVTQKAKLTLEDLALPSIRDPFVKKSLKLLASESAEIKKRNGSGKLEVPLAKRQQDQLDRSAAYDKSRETLNRWTDTIQHNRRADHLIFPLPSSDTTVTNTNARLQPTTNSKPFNELEATIQTILEESGLATVNGRDEEDKLVEFEELQSSKMSYEEVKARRDQLRMARELLFREEARAKRIKKIKSRSYRKVHRKQREKEDRMNKEALIEAGVEPSEDEKELQDRRRAEERMGSKHRGSKWAKATKQVGRATWDEDARDGLTEMARRGEELRKRVEGKIPRGDSSGDSESSADEFEEDGADDDQMRAKMLRKLQGVENSESLAGNGPGSKLSNMKFMLKAEASRKRQNDETVEQIRKELAGEESSEDEQGGTEVGRRTFGPGKSEKNGQVPRPVRKLGGYEELEGSDDAEDAIEIHTNKQTRIVSSESTPQTKGKSPAGERGTSRLTKPPFKASYSAAANEDMEGGAWSKTTGSHQTAAQTSEARRRKRDSRLDADVGELDLSQAAVAKQAMPQKAKIMPKVLMAGESGDEDSEAEDAVDLPFAIKDQELIKRAFAGADVVGEFEAEKRQTILDEEEKIIDDTLPGWGSWVGDGLSKKDKRQNKGKVLSKSEGIKERDRKDAKLQRVIINQKRVKKNTKYLASTLPYPFETRLQYERSLRLPIGPEWTTKETFQDATKPRILMKQGIIAPMSKPLL